MRPTFLRFTSWFALAGAVIALALFSLLWAEIWLGVPLTFRAYSENLILSFWFWGLVPLADRPGLEGVVGLIYGILLNVFLYFILGALGWVGIYKFRAILIVPILLILFQWWWVWRWVL